MSMIRIKTWKRLGELLADGMYYKIDEVEFYKNGNLKWIWLESIWFPTEKEKYKRLTKKK